MRNKYTTLLKVYVKGKCSIQFQQAWLCHIEEYFQPSLQLYSKAKNSISASDSSQAKNLVTAWAIPTFTLL